MINTGLIGYGNWGKKIKKILQKNTNLIFVADSKTNFKKKMQKAYT
jgi:glycerol-3-phosphate dehydrogenase